MKEKHEEIIELSKYCEEIGVETTHDVWSDRHLLRFNNSCSCEQLLYKGYIMFNYTEPELDSVIFKLEEAKKFVKENKEFLNKVFE